jgi:hypothetical protein
MKNRLVISIIGVYYALYECVFFHHPAFFGTAAWIVIGAKIVLPFVLLALAGGLDTEVFQYPVVSFYTVSFCALLGVIAISTGLSREGSVTMYEWFKFPPRFIFFIAVLQMLRRSPRLFVPLAKALLVLAGLVVVQYVVLVGTGSIYQQYVFSGVDAVFAGPFGILGNVSSLVDLPGLPFPIVRLCSFWNEPSNASATLTVAYFFSRYPHFRKEHRIWRTIGTASLVGAFLTLSNAGYFAIFGALTFREMVRTKDRPAISIPVAVIFLLCCAAAVGGRSYVARNFPDNATLKVVAGVREDLAGRNIEDYDAFSGRLNILSDTLSVVKEYPLGFGVFTGKNAGSLALSASAPLIWFTWGGLLGLAALVFRECVLFYSAFGAGRRTLGGLVLAQGLVAVFLQNMSYGDLMGPLYLTLAAFVLLHFTAPAPLALPRPAGLQPVRT